MRSARLFAALPLAFLLSCDSINTSPDPLPVSNEPVVLHFWDEGQQVPRVLIAERARQDGDRYERAVLEEVTMRLPMDDGEVVLSTHTARFSPEDGDEGGIVLAPPVRVSGVYQGEPLMGRALAATIKVDSERVELENVVWALAAQRVEIKHLLMRENFGDREATEPRSEPATAPILASLSALPKPFALPPVRVADR